MSNLSLARALNISVVQSRQSLCKILMVCFTLLLAACGNSTTVQPAISQADTAQKPTTVKAEPTDTTADLEYSTRFVLIADTGTDYAALDRQMYRLGHNTGIKVDTLNRYYDKAKKDIVVAENDDDEMYRGEYFPRRDGDDYLSIEHTSLFDTAAKQANLCIVAGLFESRKSADSLLPFIKRNATRAFVIQARVYEGCMH